MSSTLYIFDFDDTLASTDSHVRVIKSDGSIERLNSRDFAAYRQEPGDQLDFSEFDKAEGNPIKASVKDMEKAVADHGIDNVYIVTARSVSEPVEEFLVNFGITVPGVVATAGSEGKATWLTRQLETKNYERVVVYEDCNKNIRMLKDTVETYNDALKKNVEYSAVCMLPGGRKLTVEKLIRDFIRLNLYNT